MVTGVSTFVAEMRLMRNTDSGGFVEARRVSFKSGNTATTEYPCAMLNILDTGTTTSGSHQHKWQAKVVTGTSIAIVACKMVAYEL